MIGEISLLLSTSNQRTSELYSLYEKIMDIDIMIKEPWATPNIQKNATGPFYQIYSNLKNPQTSQQFKKKLEIQSKKSKTV